MAQFNDNKSLGSYSRSYLDDQLFRPALIYSSKGEHKYRRDYVLCEWCTAVCSIDADHAVGSVHEAPVEYTVM